MAVLPAIIAIAGVAAQAATKPKGPKGPPSIGDPQAEEARRRALRSSANQQGRRSTILNPQTLGKPQVAQTILGGSTAVPGGPQPGAGA